MLVAAAAAAVEVVGLLLRDAALASALVMNLKCIWNILKYFEHVCRASALVMHLCLT